MEGAIGLRQLEKIDQMIENRRSNAVYFREKMKEFPNVRLQKEIGESSWFGFSIVLTGELSKKRSAIVAELREAEIECRPIVAGNFTRNPVIKYMDYSIPEELTNSDEIHDCGFFIGNHSQNNNKEVDYFVNVFREILKNI